MALSASEMEAKIDKLETNLDRLNSIVNGGPTTTVATDSGTVPSLAKAISDIIATNPTLVVENGYLNSTVPLVFRRSLIVDWDGRLGGGPAVYIPTDAYMGNGTTVVKDVSATANADSKLTSWVKIPIAVTGNLQMIYLDTQATPPTNPYKLATYPTLMPRDAIRYQPIIALYSVDNGVWSPYAWESTRDLTRSSFVVGGVGIEYDKTTKKLRIPKLRGWTNTTQWNLDPPADNYFREYDISAYLGESGEVVFVYVDIAEIVTNGTLSANAVKFQQGYSQTTNARISRGGGYVFLLGCIFGNEFTPTHPDAVGSMGIFVPNEFGCGREDNDSAERVYSDCVPAALTKAESLALGFTRGWTSPANGGAFYGGLFKQPINGGKTLTLNVFIETDVANDFGTDPRVYLHRRNSDGSITYDAFTLALKKKHSPYLAEYVRVIAFSNGNTYVGCWAGTFGVQPGGDKRVFGLRFGFGDVRPTTSATDYPRKGDEIGSRLRALEAVFPSVGNPFDPILPAKLYLHPTRPYRIYLDQVFGPYAHGRYRATFASKKSGLGPIYEGELTQGSFEIDTSRVASTTDFAFTDIAGLQTAKTRFNVQTRILNPTAVDALNFSILTLGDSLNNWNGCGVQSIKRVRDMGATVTSMGTMKMESEVPSDGTDFELGEARSGREFADYIYMNTDACSPVAVGDEATYLAYDNTTKRSWNPFLKVPTTDDTTNRPDMIYNGRIFDFRFYLDRFSYADPGCVVINLHTNDISQQDPARSLLQIQEGLRIMVSQIRRACPSTKIVLVYNAYGRQSTELRWETEHWAGLKAFVKYIRNLGDSGVVLAPAYCTVQRDAGFKYTSVQNADTGAYTDTLDDATHYAENGIKEHAEVVAQFIAGIMTGA